jgi:hypothetical protein
MHSTLQKSVQIPDISSHTSSSVGIVKMLVPRFIVLRLKDIGNNMISINPFCIQKALDGIAGKVKYKSCLKNSTLLEEVENDKQVEVLFC